ncbi:hypothetical protein COW36_14885 [bacterium (Candidatus Blackallbacteria) CG17_big_fil_post_rev_8_21_14_2_50_48_46]|uniref:Lipoprotein n=1 Tax=bacterium (Candidatus Blackallbacteria) CG17_big_fil_post_rev_8_21_14_2_50_48_46 TaxID=2014261 RepID=A0A2M7G2H4_9BACT|nr:MAG: hypothetical protein COW64_11665 [bacterium (Candidatus Blackallbacteria) CG18_big_fil_WC_8_21_14_2_50_49_26]PIW15996.1 MAG: hypothetical protein COW36_14885 [bacterium (Candidatus Blackallbacteria) CG17_big_fil_post_rev_8_21_14_2_50_48_46]PIW50408.1 MAG: hypothetical protein COW20_02600 [bacterium (Candidatus Blackallbacteria) CG13_big_fil_rev_8_21_14_2_50_49_14]
MNKHKYLMIVLIITGFFLSACMALHIQIHEDTPPVSLTRTLRGYKTSQPLFHFQKEVWVYHIFGFPDLSLGTREGIPADQLLDQLLKQAAGPQQGIVQLKIKHEHTVWTLIASAVTLGLLVPTAVIVEGDVVNLEPLGSSSP